MQPSELAKLSLAIFRGLLSSSGARAKNSLFGKHLFRACSCSGSSPHWCSEPDLGTALMLAVIVFTMCYAAGVRARHMLIAAVPALLFVGNMLIFVPFRMKRLVAFLDPWADRRGRVIRWCSR